MTWNLVGAHGPLTCDQLAEEMGVGRGEVVAARDRMIREGYVAANGHAVHATAKALEALKTEDE